MTDTNLGGHFTFPGTSMTVNRIGYARCSSPARACRVRPKTRPRR